MESSFKIISHNINETDKIAKILIRYLKTNGGLVCLYGDIGAGKTALTTLCAKYLNIKERVTSPSFVILNEYHSGDIDFYHFDLYRLENEGLKSIADELRTYSETPNALTFVEWADFSNGELDISRLEISINYIDETAREFNFINAGIFTNETFTLLKEGIENEYTCI